MTSADVEVGQTVGQASSEAAIEKKENGHVNGSIENGDAHKGDEKKHSSSGHHSSSKDKDRDRHKDKHSSSSKDKDKHRSSSSHHSSSKDKDRHRSSDKDKDRHRSSDKNKDRHRSDKDRSEKDKERHRSDKDKHRSDKDKDREKHHQHHRSSDKDKDRDKHRSSEKDKDRDKDKEKDKDRKSHSSSSSKDKEKDRHSTSSSSKNKDRHSSSHHRSDKDKEKDRHSSSHHHHHHRSDKDKDRHSSSHRDAEKEQERKERKERERREREEAKQRMNNGAATAEGDAEDVHDGGGGHGGYMNDGYNNTTTTNNSSRSFERNSAPSNGLDAEMMTIKSEPVSPIKRLDQPMPRMTMTLVSETVKEELKEESMDQQDAEGAESGADDTKLTFKDEEASEPEDAEDRAANDDDGGDDDDDDGSDDEPLAAKLARVKQAKAEASQESGEDSDDEPLAVKLAKAKKAKAAKTGKGKGGKKRKLGRRSPASESHDNNGEKEDVMMEVGRYSSGEGDVKEDSEDDRSLEAGDNSDSDASDSESLGRALKRQKLQGLNESQETGYGSSGDSDEPLSQKLARYKAKAKLKTHKTKLKADSDVDDWDDAADSEDSAAAMKKRKKAKTKTTPKKKGARTSEGDPSPTKRKKKDEEEEEVWKWWEEEKKPEGVKWNTLEHKGPVFAPDYVPVPDNVPFFYNGKRMKLSLEAEEIATFYARMLDHDYTQKDAFNKNFFGDWRRHMTPEEKETITDLKKCDFTKYAAYFKELAELRKNRSKEEKQEEKQKNEALTKEYGFCIIDGHKQKIGNFKIEPPGLFRGRGEHPKMGKLKQRTQPEDVIINISKNVPAPTPPKGHRWKEVRHDNTVTWLCCWTENVLGSNKYIMLNPSSKLKGEKDYQKYETARRLKGCVRSIRENYQADWKSKEMRIRQRAVALYFIDKLALRAGNEKDADEQADTVGCCSLRVEHIRLHDELDGRENVVEFDFLGKDSIRYQNSVPVEKRVFKNLKLFCENKKPGDDLFDRLNTSILNKHLNELMEGLTAKVFRTYNASKTLQEQLDKLTDPNMTLAEKMLAYNRANRAVAVLCNHQRAVPKTFEKSMENLQKKIDEKEEQIIEAKREYREAKKNGEKSTADKKHKRLQMLEDQLKKLQVQATDREENKQIALGTSKLNYLDPRISVAWCKKWNVPIEKVYNKTQRDKFRWAIEMVEGDYKF